MKDIKEQVTTEEQSKKLMELGFDESTASLRWVLLSKVHESIEDILSINEMKAYKTIPCWTCTDMMNIIKDNTFYISCMNPAVVLMKTSYTNGIAHSELCNAFESVSFRDNLFDCLVWLKENKYL